MRGVFYRYWKLGKCWIPGISESASAISFLKKITRCEKSRTEKQAKYMLLLTNIAPVNNLSVDRLEIVFGTIYQ